MASLSSLKVQLYADGADKAGILDLYAKPHIKGLTTNPSLMKKAGIKDYEAFAKDILQTVTAKPISLEVFSDDITDMKRQAAMIKTWGAHQGARQGGREAQRDRAPHPLASAWRG
jgi:transaldolase